MANVLHLGVYLAILTIVLLIVARKKQRQEQAGRDTFRESVEAGLTQPPSLHPVVNPLKCIGCESCINACPEFPAHQVLGLVNGKARLVSPTDCIGHGACQSVCPVGAISLVFGTEERGIDLPAVRADFSTNVDGVYIAGELGGMGLIRNAIEQGRQAIECIAQHLEGDAASSTDVLDVVIIGAGPAGIAATLGAMESGLRHVSIEQNALGGTVANFPRGKLVMTAPAELPLVGNVRFTETKKEELVEFWHKVQRDTNMQIQCGERLLDVERTNAGSLLAKTDKGTYETRSVLLAIGRRGTPRTLGVPGEERSKVCYAMIDPAQYNGKHVLVVGGGDSAIEAACSIADESDARVTLSYRGDAFARAKKKNRERLEQAEQEGRLKVYLKSNVAVIGKDNVVIETASEVVELHNDVVIICAGGILPNWLLEQIGITVETKYGTA